MPADQLCTTAQVKARLFPAGTTDTADDTLISELIDQVSDWVQSFTGRRLVPVTSATYIMDTRAGYVLYVPMGLRTVTAFGVNNSAHQPDTGGTYTTVAATDYLLRPRAHEGPLGWPFTEIHLARAAVGTIHTFGNIENGATVTGTAGFATTPPEIVSVTIDGVVAAYQSRKNGVTGVMGPDDGPLVTLSAFSKASRMTLARYTYGTV